MKFPEVGVGGSVLSIPIALEKEKEFIMYVCTHSSQLSLASEFVCGALREVEPKSSNRNRRSRNV